MTELVGVYKPPLVLLAPAVPRETPTTSPTMDIDMTCLTTVLTSSLKTVPITHLPCIPSHLILVLEDAHGVWIYLDYPSQYTYTGVGGLEDVNIEVIVGRQITVRLIDYDVVITFSRYFLSVRAPLSYRGKLCGLLGDCDGDMSNDFKLQNGSVSDLMTFEEEYRAPHVNSSCSFRGPMPATCDPAILSEAQTFCNSLINPTGSYSNCHDVISSANSYDSCVLDYCFVNADDTLTTVCRVIQDYADECRFHGIQVGFLPADCREWLSYHNYVFTYMHVGCLIIVLMPF